MNKKFLLLQFMVNVLWNTQQTESPSKSKEFQRKYFPSCYASGRVYLEKRPFKKIRFKRIFCLKPTQYTISSEESDTKKKSNCLAYSRPENLKRSKPKISSNKINQFHGIFSESISWKIFKKISGNWFIWFHKFFWPGIF